MYFHYTVHTMTKKIISIALYLFLCACSTTSQTQNPQAAEINAKLALAYLSQHNPERGKAKLLLAQKQAPNDPAVWYMSGYFLEQTGDYTAARSAYLTAIQLAPHLG